jgi:hypothetical protein
MNSYSDLARKPQGKRPLGRPRSRLEDNIKMDLGEMGCDGMVLVHLGQDTNQVRPLVKTIRKVQVP